MTPEIIRAQRDHERRLAYEETLETPVFALSVAVINDTKTAGTSAGAFTSGAWQTRDLNTEQSDIDGIVTIAANQFTLAAGTYHIYASAPAYYVAQHKTRLYNATDATVAAYGSAEYSSASMADGIQSRSVISAVVVIAASKAFEIQHRCASTRIINGFGVALSVEVEIYTIVTITRLA